MAASSDSTGTDHTAASNAAATAGSAVSRRQGVTIGPLPDDFLRVNPPAASMTNSLPVTVEHGEQHPQNVSPQRRAMHPAYVQQMAYVPPNTLGRLVLSVVQAKLIKSYSMVFKMDPYCRVRVGHQVFETPTAHAGGKNPTWNKTIQCYLPIGCDKIDVDIFDEKSFGEDERVAWTQVDIPPAVYEGDTVDDWFPLSGKSGAGTEGSIQITFSLHVNSATSPPRMMMPGMGAAIPGMGAPLVYMPGYYPAVQGPVQGMVPPQGPVVTGRMYSDDDLRQVKEMFPDMDGEVVQSVLEAQRGNVQATIDALLQMNA